MNWDSPPLEAQQDYPFTSAITGTGVITTGWTQFLFAIKQRLEDDDSDALVMVQKSNPTQTDDGLVTLNGITPPASPAVPADASITVGTISPFTSVTVTLDQQAMNIISSAAVTPADILRRHGRAYNSTPFFYELAAFGSFGKLQIAAGLFIVDKAGIHARTQRT